MMYFLCCYFSTLFCKLIFKDRLINFVLKDSLIYGLQNGIKLLNMALYGMADELFPLLRETVNGRKSEIAVFPTLIL